MKPSFRRRVFNRVGRAFGIHPDVSGLISGAFRLANPEQAAVPSENMPNASRVVAAGFWNYSFFQFYPHISGPFWVHRQYDPADPAFIPRAGSPLSVNLTHRDWLGLRAPDSTTFGLVDPAGALSPVAGYYSLEFGILRGGRLLLASRGDLTVRQSLLKQTPIPRTEFSMPDLRARWTVAGSADNPELMLSVIDYRYTGREPASIVIGVRPFNPEGGVLIHNIETVHRQGGGLTLALNELKEIMFLKSPDGVALSGLQTGDAYSREPKSEEAQVQCPFGVSTAALHFELKRNRGQIAFVARNYQRELHSKADAAMIRRFIADAGEQKRRRLARLRTPGTRMRVKKAQRIKNIETTQLFDEQALLGVKGSALTASINKSRRRWKSWIDEGAEFRCARKSWNRAARVYRGFVLSLQTGTEVTPGVFTYNLFWFRDAAYMLNALASWNYRERAERVLRTYPGRQDRIGFFRSQDGEWDSNGQAIWSLVRHGRMFGDQEFLKKMYPSIQRGALWIEKKIKHGYQGRLLPPGFSAEHLGPADHYYWDNLWSLAGLRETAYLADYFKDEQTLSRTLRVKQSFEEALRDVSAEDRKQYGVLTAAPGRALDAGMIGSIVMLYPLRLDLFDRDLMEGTINAIRQHFMPEGLFFQSMIHSGHNLYLSLQVAQCFLQLGNVSMARRIFRRVLRARQELWTFPEAIHPRTGGGAMGDGFHGWAFAEVLLFLRELVLQEDGESLLLLGGLTERELAGPDGFRFGPFPAGGAHVILEGELNNGRGTILVRLQNHERASFRALQVQLPEGAKDVNVRGTDDFRLKDGRVFIPGPVAEMRIRFRQSDG